MSKRCVKTSAENCRIRCLESEKKCVQWGEEVAEGAH